VDNGTVVVRLTELVAERLIELGCDERELRARGVIPSGSPWRRVPFERLCELVEVGLELVDEPDLGLRLRRDLDARTGGVLVLTMLACTDVRAALHRLERFQRIGFDAHRISLEDRGRCTVVTFPGPERPALRHLREWLFADAVGSVLAMTGRPARALEVTFSHPRPPSAERVERFFGCSVRFGAPRTTLWWPDEVLDRPLLHANQVFLAAFEEQAKDLLASLPSRRTWVERARAALREGLPEEIEVDHVAARLGVTPRTLQRRLHVEGSSVVDVLTDLRRELAASYLAEGRDVAEVGYLLGYASVTAFHRAFRGWYDTTPSAFRERARTAG
jgi:AraC-like DNA-binding protein